MTDNNKLPTPKELCHETEATLDRLRRQISTSAKIAADNSDIDAMIAVDDTRVEYWQMHKAFLLQCKQAGITPSFGGK